MPRWIAFLRAINVGGHVVKMHALKAIFEAIGFENVETFIASGNVLFDSKEKNAAKLEARIEKELKAALGYESSTYIRAIAELQKLVGEMPYGDKELGADGYLQVGFFRDELTKESRDLISKLITENHDFRFGDKEVFWLLRGRFSENPLKGDLAARKLVATGTFRNIKMLRRLAAKCS